MSRILILALLVALLPGSALAPSSQTIQAEAPFEVWADGFTQAAGIAVDGEDRVYVSDRAAGTVTRLDQDGRRSVVAHHLARPVGLAIDMGGRLLVAEEGAARVIRLDGASITTLAVGVRRARWLALGADATLYISARRLAPGVDVEPEDDPAEPQMIVALSPAGALSVFADGFIRLQGLGLDRGALHAAASGTRGDSASRGVVYRIPILADGRAGVPRPVEPAGAPHHPIGLARDRLGALYVGAHRARLDAGRARDAVVKLQAGAATLFAAGLDDPRGLAFDSGGHLYVADGAAGRVLRFLAPPAPTLAVPPRFTNQASVALSGTTTPGARVDVLLDEGAVSFSTTVDSTGAFVASITPMANAESAIAVHSTPADGRGLTSPAAGVSLTHDTIAPVAVFQAPAAGAVVRGATMLRVEAADSASAIAGVGLSAAGRPLETTIAPAPPEPAVVATAPWSTVEVLDGTHTLTAAIRDRAGNHTGIGRVVLVDNTPPETEITEGPGGVITEATATFSFAGLDNLTPASALRFAWRLDGSSWSDFGDATTVTLADLAPGDHLFEVMARDQAGNEDPTPAGRAFTCAAGTLPRITITEPGAGAVVAPGPVIVRGSVDGAGGDVSVTVNGFGAPRQETTWAVAIPVAAGSTDITAVAAGPSGAQATASITLTVAGPEPAVILQAEPGRGVTPLSVTWRIASRAPRPLVRFELDPTGVDGFGPPLSTFADTQSIYPTAGLFVPALRATDDQGNVHVARTVVQVEDRQATAARFERLWADFKARLLVGDSPGALDYLTPGLRSRFQPLFQQLGADLPAVAAGLGDIHLLGAVEHLAEAAILQVEEGAPFLYFVYFRRDNRGRWLIQEM